MAEQRQTDERASETDPPAERSANFRRRGLIAAAAALVVGLVAKNQPAAAAQIVGTNNYTGSLDTTADGVQGYATGSGNAGVFGRNNSSQGYGLRGEAPSGIGVWGDSSAGYGVVGNSASSHAIYGAGAAAGLAGVYGQGNAANAMGVIGNAGVTGAYAGAFYGPVSLNGSTTATAVANSNTHSVIGYGNSANYAGILGSAAVANAFAVYGYGATAGSYAGYFSGRVWVGGDFAVTGSKSAVVPHPTDGTYRLLYCVESPESWFEDVGEGTLTAGKASVTLDPDFAALIHTETYHVFLTEHDDHNALFVTNRNATGFEVHAKNAPAAHGTFSYRLVALRKDGTHPRLAKVEAPDTTKITVPAAPKVDVKGVEPPKP